jgi:hypothetical protein
MRQTQYRDPADNYRERRQERAIRDDFAQRVIDDPDFTHCITINFVRDIATERQQKQDNFLSSLSLEIQHICLNQSVNRLKKLPLNEMMKFRSVPEDYEKTTDIRTPRHFNIQVAMPSLDNQMNQLKLKSEANRLAQTILGTKICNFHIDKLPTEKQSRTRRIAYDYKNAFRPESFDRIISEIDFATTKKKKTPLAR